MFQGLDHLAIVVPDTAAALLLWRDRFGFPVVAQEAVNDGTVLLTHLDLGNTVLQLVEPLVAYHPLRDWLDAHGPGLHHFCLTVDNVGAAMAAATEMELPPGQPAADQGVGGKRALFLDSQATAGVRVELTGR